MSAILGRINFDKQPVNRGLFETVFGSLEHYGPDGFGLALRDDWALGQRHFAVSRQSPKEQSPHTDGRLTIVADAILDDRPELVAALGMEVRNEASYPDSVLLLAAWRKWGEDCPRYILGDFAFAIWDDAERRLHLVRDHIGARPLYWWRLGRSVLFSTDIRALVTLGEGAADIDWHTVAHFLTKPVRPVPKCFFKDMCFVRPGEIATIMAGGTNFHRWWRPEELTIRPPGNLDDVLAQVLTHTVDAVQRKVDSDLPIGSHVSGGIDSTAVASIASSILQERGSRLAGGYMWAPEIGAGYPLMGDGDERGLAAPFCKKLDIPLRFGSENAGETKYASLKRPLAYEGTADLSEELDVLCKAQSDGVKVLLSGWGGDETFSAPGIGYLSWLLKGGKFRRALHVAIVQAGGRHPRKLLPTVWRNGVLPALPAYLYRFFPPFLDMFPDNCFARMDVLLDGSDVPSDDIRLLPDPKAYLYSLLRRGHVAARMDTWTLWGAEHGIQYRYPLTDRRLLEFVLSLSPLDQFLDGGFRQLPAKALRATLPPMMNKHDLANETKRGRMRADVLALLRIDENARALAVAADWLDDRAYTSAMEDKFNAENMRSISNYVQVCGATRVLFMR